MLSQLRQSTKTILWVVIVAFVGMIFVVWGMNLRKSGGVEAGFVGRVAGDRITVDEYRNEVANQRQVYYQDQDRRPGVYAEKEIAETTRFLPSRLCGPRGADGGDVAPPPLAVSCGEGNGRLPGQRTFTARVAYLISSQAASAASGRLVEDKGLIRSKTGVVSEPATKRHGPD